MPDPVQLPADYLPPGVLFPPEGGLRVLPGHVVDKMLAIGLEGIAPALDHLSRKYPHGFNVYPVFAGMLPFNVQQQKLVMTPADGKSPGVAMMPCFLFISVAQGNANAYRALPQPVLDNGHPLPDEAPAEPTNPAVPKGMRLVLPEETQR